MTRLQLTALTKIYPGQPAPAVRALTLAVNSGERVALLGPSGCGKTSALKMVAGLLDPSSGEIEFDGQSVLSVPAERRGAVLMFQNHLLFPHLSVGENVGFGLKMRGESPTTIRARVAEMLERVQLAGFEGRSPREISGGQAQRVALARALILRPRVLLLDEPFSNLDAHLRDDLRALVLDLQAQLGLTTIVVTHDQQEAVMLADRVAVLFDGQLQQYAPPRELYARPASARLARFFGNPNVLRGVRRGSQFVGEWGTVCVTAPLPADPVALTIRPERIVLAASGENVLHGEVMQSVYVGTHLRHKIRLDANTMLEALTDTAREVGIGDTISVSLPAEALWPIPEISQ
jgi:ABC-type Fe3+/spermidine/putrescine transport system ATPase subunit